MRKGYWFLIFLIAFAVVTAVVYARVIGIGAEIYANNHFLDHPEYLEYTFYALSAILYIALVVDPLISIFFKPMYSVARVAGGEKNNPKRNRKLAKNILKYGNLKEEDKESVKEILESGDAKRLNKKLYLLYNNALARSMEAYIMDTAKNTLYLTAVSQHGFLDMVIVLVNNFRMVKALVRMAGFRPTFLRVLKLYLNIFASSLVADGAQSINITNLIGTSMGSALKIVANSLSNGVINAFFMLRTGYLCKHYLFTEDVPFKKTELRKTALMEAASLLPTIITSVVTDPIKGLGKLFFKGNSDGAEADEDEDIVVDLNQKWTKKK